MATYVDGLGKIFEILCIPRAFACFLTEIETAIGWKKMEEII